MADRISRDQRSAVMRAVRGKDTTPEMAVRRLAHALGYRFRLHVADLPGKPDLVFSGRRKVIFVHGCFWHWHRCKRGRRMPQAHAEYWSEKLHRNQERDRSHRRALRRAGWQVLVVWECQTKDLRQLEKKLRQFLETP